MHFAILRREPRYPGRADVAVNVYAVGYVEADCEFDAGMITDTMSFRIRGKERLILVELGSWDAIRQAKAVQRERDRCLADCIAVLERIHFSVD